ncbi:MAG: hypothetical protein Q9166_006948 [cf. Caloplaca sp. 2 TL-2023]
MSARHAKFAESGFECTQSGVWTVGGGESAFAFFERKGKEEGAEDGEVGPLGTCFETIAFQEGWGFPEPEEWFPVRTAEVVEGGAGTGANEDTSADKEE